MVEFHQILALAKVQSTPRAAPLLPLEEGSPPRRDIRMAAQASCPIDPVAVIRATHARDFRIPTNRRVGMTPQPQPVGRFECPLTFPRVPVFFTDPPRRLIRMTATCPAPQVGIKPSIHAGEGPLGRHRRIVDAPALDERIEAFNEHLLGRGAQFPHFLMQLAQMPALPCFGGLDAGFEAQRNPLAGFPGLGLPDRVLPDMESEEVKPCGAPTGWSVCPSLVLLGFNANPSSCSQRAVSSQACSMAARSRCNTTSRVARGNCTPRPSRNRT